MHGSRWERNVRPANRRKALLKYYVFAAIIVCGIGTILALRAHPLPAWNMRSVQATASPTIGRGQPKSHYRAGNFEGIDAPWALSALPECLMPQSVYRAKTVAEVLVHLPAGASPVPAGRVIVFANCSIAVGRDDAMVTRGRDRFHIPPQSHFYRTATKLVLVRFSRRAELRVYAASNL
ncbi:MAG: hypothetical protein NVS9B12_02510 [Vulcanimicrobiaceae bacterium]